MMVLGNPSDIRPANEVSAGLTMLDSCCCCKTREDVLYSILTPHQLISSSVPTVELQSPPYYEKLDGNSITHLSEVFVH